MSVQLRNAIIGAKNFAELIPIARQLKTKLSFWGRRYVEIESKNGEASIWELVDRMQSIIEEKGYTRSTYPEKTQSTELAVEIDRIYRTNRENITRANIITKIAVICREVFAYLFIENYKSYQSRWTKGGV